MANKFTKSVLERQAKEQRARPAPMAEVPVELPVLTVEPIEDVQTEPEIAPPAPVRAKKPAAAPVPDLTDFIVKEQGRAAKNKTFYLDAAVIDALHRAAVAQKITDSKLVNDILKKLLGV